MTQLQEYRVPITLSYTFNAVVGATSAEMAKRIAMDHRCWMLAVAKNPQIPNGKLIVEMMHKHAEQEGLP